MPGLKVLHWDGDGECRYDFRYQNLAYFYSDLEEKIVTVKIKPLIFMMANWRNKKNNIWPISDCIFLGFSFIVNHYF